MIFAGSALMIYNIIRYGTFVRKTNELERYNRMRILYIVPLLLLVFFLIGYLVIGFSRVANLMVALILLGGSIFVFLLLQVLYTIVGRMRDTDAVLSTRYEEMKESLAALTKDSLSTFRVNLTKDEIEDRAGTNLYESDYATDRYSEMIKARNRNVVDPDYYETNSELFTRDGLLQHYLDGQTTASEVVLVQRSDGETGFVRFEANLTKKPVSGDIVAFLIEHEFDEHVIRNLLLNRVLMDHFDRIAYLIDGNYHVLVSNAGQKENLVIPDDAEGTYESVYLNYILPALPKDRKPSGQPNPLRLSVIDKALADQPIYEYTTPFVINGKTFYKQFLFYRVDVSAKYYLMLIGDVTTEAELRAEIERCNAAGNAAVPETAPDKAEDHASVDAPDPDASPDVNNAVPSVSFVRPLRVLLVDDNPINREIGELILTKEGFSVSLASDGKEAADCVASAEPPFDLVLMDVQMPVMNGLEATKAIRSFADPGRAATPVIGLSASNDPKDAKEAIAAGMNDYASKPIEADVILRLAAGLVPDAVKKEEGRDDA